MSDAERYRERAVQAERLAAEMTNQDHRAQLLAIAADWRLMAEKASAPTDPAVVVPFSEADPSAEPSAP